MYTFIRVWTIALVLLFTVVLNAKPLALRGYNINWSFLPVLDKNFLGKATELKPQIIRYPGGTVSKTWDWRSGRTSKRRRDIPHPLRDLKRFKERTGAKVIFVLNMISSTLPEQMAMLKSAKDMGIAIHYIEMGNEHYLGKGRNVDDSGKHQDNVRAFPTGREYAIRVNQWAKELKKVFPHVKIGITMLGRTNTRRVRQKTWNSTIMAMIDTKLFDAYIYHIYVHPRGGYPLTEKSMQGIIKKRTDDLERAMVKSPLKEIWITEYGVHTKTAKENALLTSKLADYTESLADISLPQVLYSRSRKKFFSLLRAPKAKNFTELGEMFKRRVE